MVVLIVVAVACFIAGVYTTTRWLPELADGPVGFIAFFVVSGLAGAALSLAGIEIDGMVRGLEEGGFGGVSAGGRYDADVVGGALATIFRDSGTITALALVAYLLAPKQASARARAVEASPGD